MIIMCMLIVCNEYFIITFKCVYSYRYDARNFVVQKNSKISACDAWPHRKKLEVMIQGCIKEWIQGHGYPAMGRLTCKIVYTYVCN